jgi:hypothetical protein
MDQAVSSSTFGVDPPRSGDAALTACDSDKYVRSTECELAPPKRASLGVIKNEWLDKEPKTATLAGIPRSKPANLRSGKKRTWGGNWQPVSSHNPFAHKGPDDSLVGTKGANTGEAGSKQGLRIFS